MRSLGKDVGPYNRALYLYHGSNEVFMIDDFSTYFRSICISREAVQLIQGMAFG